MPPPVDPIPELKRQAAAALVPLLARWRAHEAASLIGTDQPRISDIRRGKLERFSLETLIRYCVRLRCRVELQITVEPQPGEPAERRSRHRDRRPTA